MQSRDHDYAVDGNTRCENIDRIQIAASSVNNPVVELKSAHTDLQKYSVVSRNDIQFVHVFRSDQNSTTYIKCMSGICQRSFAKQRKSNFLHTSQKICPHLQIYRDHLKEQKSGIFSNLFNVIDLSLITLLCLAFAD